MSVVSICIIATPPFDPADGTTRRPRDVSAGTRNALNFLTSGHTATSTPWMRPPRTSRITHEPSEPASSTEPDAPSAYAQSARLEVRNAVSVSQRYYTADGMSGAGSICTVTFTRPPTQALATARTHAPPSIGRARLSG